MERWSAPHALTPSNRNLSAGACERPVQIVGRRASWKPRRSKSNSFQQPGEHAGRKPSTNSWQLCRILSYLDRRSGVLTRPAYPLHRPDSAYSRNTKAQSSSPGARLWARLLRVLIRGDPHVHDAREIISSPHLLPGILWACSCLRTANDGSMPIPAPALRLAPFAG